MQFDSIAESSYRSFLQYYQAALGIRQTPVQNPKICVFVFICQFTMVSLYTVFFQTIFRKTYKVLIL